MKTLLKQLCILSITTLLWVGQAHALPKLQLTIDGGSYDPYTESTITYDRQFDLYALLDTQNADLDATYYISAAIVPLDGQPDLPVTSLGSFTFAGQTVDLAHDADIEFGTPEGLPTHGEFPAYYEEFAFHFDGARTAAFNAETVTPAGTLTAGCSSDCVYFEMFSVDMTQLHPNFSVHFDLYTKTSDGEVALFAPFSHDAEMRARFITVIGDDDDDHSIPEPQTPALLVIALAAMQWARMRRLRGDASPVCAAA